MATTLYLLDTVADTHLGTDNLNGLAGIGTAVAWTSRALGTARGSGVVASTNTPTQTATPHPVQVGGVAAEWISPPVSADVTISGNITFNVWASESNMSANVVLATAVDVIRANALGTRNSNTLVDFDDGTTIGAELAVTTRAVRNVSAGPVSTVVNRGDRLRVRIMDGGGATSTYTWNIGYNGTTASVDGDTYVTFTENFSFESAPSGTVLYPTGVTSDVDVGAHLERTLALSRGTTAVTAATNTATGWTAPIQMTTSAGGNIAEWYTPQLSAFTLTGLAVANIRIRESNALANASVRCELARVDSDGTNATVWASWCIAPTGTDNGEVTTTEVARTANVSGDDLAFTDGQRIRLRFYVEDLSSAALVTGYTTSLTYAGTSGGASGDSYITLAQTVTEFGGGGPFTYTKSGYAKESA